MYEGFCAVTDPIEVPIDETLYPPVPRAVDPPVFLPLLEPNTSVKKSHKKTKKTMH